MDYLTIIAVTLAAIGVVGMAWLGGYEVGSSSASNAISAERDFADRRIQGLLASLNEKKPRLRYRKVDARSVGRKRYLNTKLKEVA